MARNVTTVTHPDGTVSRRTSASAVYTHAVVVGPLIPEVAAAARRADAVMLRESAVILDRAAAAANYRIVRQAWRNRDGSTTDTNGADVALLDSATPANRYGVTNRCSVEGIATTYIDGVPVDVPVLPLLVETARAEAARYRALADTADEQAERYAAGCDLGGYAVVRWSSRADLAAKALAGEFAYRVEMGHAVAVVAVD